jgi:hypothetical protein
VLQLCFFNTLAAAIAAVIAALIAAALDQYIFNVDIKLLKTRKIFRAPGCS